MSLSNFIKTILNIQDNNISFPEEDYCHVIQKGNYLIKLFKGFLKDNCCVCPHCNSKNIVKNGSRERNIKFIPFQNYNIELNLTVQRHICKDCKKSFSPSTNIVEDNSNISNNLKYTIAHELQENISLTSIANKYKLSTKDKVDYLLEKSSELDVNFNIYQDILQAIKHNNFKRFENIVKKNLSKKEKVSKQMLTALKTLKKYMKYIENMFESNITNGLIEGLNNKIKSIKRTAFGYSNFSNFKKHILIEAGIISISA